MLAPNDDIPLRFLRLVLPPEGIGYYLSASKLAKAKGFKSQTFASAIEAQWSNIESADHDGYESYHALAVFREPRFDPPRTPAGDKRFGRTKHNALGARAFWLDIDVGPGKP